MGSSVAMADMQCDRDLLLDMSAEILEHRGGLKGFTPRRIGGDAAYFALKYGAMDEQEISAKLQNGRAYYAPESILLSARITGLGAGRIDEWGNDPREVLIEGEYSLHRAIVLLDNGKTYFRLLDDINSDEGWAERYKSRWLLGANLYALVTDQPQEVLREIAENAEDHGYLNLAAPLFALLPEGEYEEFRERTIGTDPNPALTAPLYMNGNGTIAFSRSRPLPSGKDAETFEEELQRLFIFLTIKASMAEAGAPILTIALNQTGREEDFALISERYLAAVESGQIDPHRKPDEGWAFLLSQMVTQLGATETHRTLSGFDTLADRRHYGGRALDTMQMAVAIQAARSWLTGETDEIPARPLELSQDFDWDAAMSIWASVKDGDQIVAAGLNEIESAQVIEGYLQRSEYEKALEISESVGGLDHRVRVARDIMFRQNRLCDQFGILPGAAFMLGGGPLIYTFEPGGSSGKRNKR